MITKTISNRRKLIQIAGVLLLVFVMLFIPINYDVTASTPMIVPNGTPVEQVTDWTELQDAVNNAVGSVDIHVMNDITADFGAITIPAGTKVYLRSNPDSSNTYSLYQDIAAQRHFLVNGGDLSIGNIQLTRITLVGSSFPSGGISVQNNGNLEMFAGTIISGNESNIGGGIYVNSASFIMYGGIISGNTGSIASGGVRISFNANFIMWDGTIKNNSSGTHGGGVSLHIDSTFTMNGGTIKGNIANAGSGGGGVLVANNSTFSMTEGTIEGNTALSISGTGGGVSLVAASTFIMDGGTIRDNTAIRGGGVGVINQGTSFIVNDGIISGNTATLNGGGIFTQSYAWLTISDAAIFIGNTAASAHDFYLSLQYPSGSVPPAQIGDPAGFPFPWFGGVVPPSIQWASTSIAGAHLLNNYDINFIGAPAISYQVVTFNPNGGTFANTPLSQLQADGESQWRWISQIADTGTPNPTYSLAFDEDGDLENLSLPHPTREYYIFGGWFNSQANANGTTQVGRVLYTDAITNDTSRILWARWTRKTVDVTFAPGTNGSLAGGTPNVVISVPHGTSLTLANIPNVLPNAGWVHTGWDEINPIGYNVTEPVTFTALWTRKMIDVTFVPGINGSLTDGTPNVVISVPYGTVLNLSDIPSVIPNSGWLHIGWGAINPIGLTVTESITFTALYEPEENGGNTPDTSDTTNIWRYITLMSGGLFVMVVVTLFEIKSRRKQSPTKV